MLILAANGAQAAYELVWEEEFNGTSLNSDVWTYEIGNNGGWGNSEAEYYTNRAENLSLADGKMTITAKKEQYVDNQTTYNYTSARIKTSGKVQVKYGRFESLIKTTKGYAGIWPAFWMLGTARDGNWPYCGEIDIMEEMCTSDQTTWKRTLSTFHWNNKGINGAYENVNYGKEIYFDNELGDEYRIFGMEWTPSSLIGYVKDSNGNNYRKVVEMDISKATDATNGLFAFHNPFYFLYNVAVGGTYVQGQIDASLQSANMQVQWLRVYQDYDTYPTSTLLAPDPSTEPELCTNSFASYTASVSTVEDGGNWGDVSNITVNGTTLTVTASKAYTNMYATATGNNNKLISGQQYTFKGTIKSSVATTATIYVEDKSDNTKQIFTDNKITFTANETKNFEVTTTVGTEINPKLVLHTQGVAGTFTISDVEIKGSSCGEPEPEPEDPELCKNSFASYTAQNTTVNENGWWHDIDIVTINGTTITVKPTASYTDMYATATGNGNTLTNGEEYVFKGTIKCTADADITLYVEDESDNTKQVFLSNTLNLKGNEEKNFEIKATPGSDINPKLVLAAAGGPANVTYTISDIVVKGSGCKTAIEESESKSVVSAIEVYPNPASAYILVDSNKEVAHVVIYNLNGRIMGSYSDSIIDVAGYDAGYYIVVAELEDGTTAHTKLIKK